MKTPQAATPALSDDPAFGFPSGRIRALENQLLDRPRYERLARSRDLAEFAAALADTPYGRYLDAGGADFALAVDRAGQENRAFLAEYAGAAGWLADLFELPDRVRQLKQATKSLLAGAGAAESGGEQAAAIVAAAMAGLRSADAGELRADAARTVKAALEEFGEERDPARVDYRLDRLEQRLACRLAVKSELLAACYSLHADAENLRMLVRLKASGDDAAGQRAGLEAAMLEGGAVKPAEFVALLSAEWGAIAARFAGTALGPAAAEGAEQAQRLRSFARMERLGREAGLALLRRTRYAVYGHELLAAFYLLHENEIRNLRQLHAARMAGLAPEAALELFAWVA